MQVSPSRYATDVLLSKSTFFVTVLIFHFDCVDGKQTFSAITTEYNYYIDTQLDINNTRVNNFVLIFTARLMSHKYHLMSRESTPSNKASKTSNEGSTSNSSFSSSNNPASDNTQKLQELINPFQGSLYFTGFIPIFRETYAMSVITQEADPMANAGQINVVTASLDNRNEIGGVPNPAQDFLPVPEPVDRSRKEAIIVDGDEYKQNKLILISDEG